MRFAAELASLAALFTWGVHGVGGAPAGCWRSPRRRCSSSSGAPSWRRERRAASHDPARLVAEVVLFGLAALALVAADLPVLGAIYAVAAVLGIVLVRWGPGATPDDLA